MKPTLRRPLVVALLGAGLAIPLARAQNQTLPPTRNGLPIIPGMKILEGEAFFLERIALPPRSKLHVSLVGRVAGAEYLPIATQVLPARQGRTPYQLYIPIHDVPPPPYRLQAWIVGDNRLLMQGREAQTTLKSLDAPINERNIRLKIVPAPRNIDGIGDGQPIPPKMTLKGTVSTNDRRALLPDSRLEIELRDVSLADAPSKLVMGQVIQLEGQGLPKSFELELEPGDLVPRRRYALSAKLLEAGKLTLISNTLTPVSPDNLGQNFELRVVSAAPTP